MNNNLDIVPISHLKIKIVRIDEPPTRAVKMTTESTSKKSNSIIVLQKMINYRELNDLTDRIMDTRHIIRLWILW